MSHDPISLYLNSGEIKKQREKSGAKMMIAFAVVLVAGFYQITQWDKYAFEVIPLQIYVLSGTTNAQNHLRLSQICFDRGKYDCSQNALESYIQLKPEDQKVRFELGLLQLKRNQLKEGLKTLKDYVDRGGNEPRARFELGKTYSQLGMSKKARQQFMVLLKEKDQVFQVSVTREYIRTLIQEKRWLAAKKMIEKSRRKSLVYNAFMTAEYKEVLKNIHDRRVASR